MRNAIVMAAAAVLVGAAAVLYWIPPTAASFYPRCLFHTLTGFHCPGCGLTRCVHALLHGDLRQAAAYNALALLFLPVLAVCGVRALWAQGKPRAFSARPLPPWFFRMLFCMLITYWILRNLDFAPFNLLAPHQL